MSKPNRGNPTKTLGLLVVTATIIAPALGAQETGTVAGRVVDELGQPIESAKVSIATLELSDLTRPNGTYLLLGIPDGEHTIAVERQGFHSAMQTVSVRATEATIVDFTLVAVVVEPYLPSRGDVDLTDTLNLTDAIYLLQALFRGAGPVRCPGAADFNDSGTVDLSDAVGILRYLFQGIGSPTVIRRCFDDELFMAADVGQQALVELGALNLESQMGPMEYDPVRQAFWMLMQETYPLLYDTAGTASVDDDSFTPFLSPVGTVIQSNLLPDPDGGIWLANVNGIYYYRPDDDSLISWPGFRIVGRIAHINATTLVFANEDTDMWILDHGGTIDDQSDDQWEHIDYPPPVDLELIGATDQGIWFFVSRLARGLVYYDRTAFEVPPSERFTHINPTSFTPMLSNGNSLDAGVLAPDGSLWLTYRLSDTFSGVLNYNPGSDPSDESDDRWVAYDMRAYLGTQRKTVGLDPAGRVWLGREGMSGPAPRFGTYVPFADEISSPSTFIVDDAEKGDVHFAYDPAGFMVINKGGDIFTVVSRTPVSGE